MHGSHPSIRAAGDASLSREASAKSRGIEAGCAAESYRLHSRLWATSDSGVCFGSMGQLENRGKQRMLNTGESPADTRTCNDPQIFYSPDAQIEADALDTFRAMIVTLYPEGKENSIDMAQEIIKECSELLQEPEKSKAKPATKILSGLVLASRMSWAIAFPPC